MWRKRQTPTGDPERWLVLDVESSGLDASRDRLLALAAVSLRFDARRAWIELADSFEVVLRQPEDASPPDRANILVHGIGIATQGRGLDPVQALQRFEAFAADAPLLGFHVAFDKQLIDRATQAQLGRRLRNRLQALAEVHGEKIALGGEPSLGRERLSRILSAALKVTMWVLALVATAEWVGFSMSQFPYTRRWGEQMHQSAIELAKLIFGAIAHSLPGLAVALAIFLLARAVLGMLAPLFSQVERGELHLPWVDQDTVRATRRLVHIAIWLFALAMAYPYLPGAQTEAFKGMSVLLGLMVSLGASSMLGQAFSGLIVTYNHTMRVGEYVRVGDVEGTVTEVGTFTTRVRTGMGEELTIPNTLVVGSVTRNYSRSISGSGYIVDTVLTIGYDVPWRQVQAMMLEAARRTQGVSEAPPPKVFQTALSDYYAEYRLIAHALASRPRPRAEVLDQLHANLQDVFNENGVQIMSPHYRGDPERAKIVPREEWDPPLVGKG